jgi:Xaa-Pro aminopeptidase
MAKDVLIYADTLRSPELRHEVPAAITDPFLYAETGGRTVAVVSSLDREALLAARPEADVLAPDELGLDEIVAAASSIHEVEVELAARACAQLGIASAAVPPSFPVGLADRLRADGLTLEPDAELFTMRRRTKSAAELEGVRRAQRAAEAGMRAAAEMLRAARATADGNPLELDGEALTAERLREAIRRAFDDAGAASDEILVAPGPQSAVGHVMGSGPIVAGQPLVIDLWPQDRESACFADMTRTFVVGEPPEQVARWHALCREALERSTAAVRPGVRGRDVYGVACDVFEAAGVPTQRTKPEGEELRDGFFHSLGHGVGLEVHEAPGLGRIGEPLVAGDVIAIEPGSYRQGFGGVRLEDLVLVTDDGAEVLTDFPYDLAP